MTKGKILNNMKTVFGSLVLLVIFTSSIGFKSAVSICRPKYEQGHVFSDPSSPKDGYTLVSSYIGDNLYSKPGKVRLIDRTGRVAHSWQTQYQPLYAKLEKSGHIYVTMTPPIVQANYPSAGTTGVIQELDWNSKVLWEYKDDLMTHSFDVLPNGSIVYDRWEKAPEDFTEKVVGGFPKNVIPVWTNSVVEVNRDKKKVWEWQMPDHLNPEEFKLAAATPKWDWAHVNSVKYVADNPINHKPAFLVSARHLSTAMFIDIESKDVLWRSPAGMFSYQHDATYLSNGHVMVFDNGFNREDGNPILLSRVVEVDPLTNHIAWEYKGGDSLGEQAALESSIMGGANRLPNGNTLITISTQGKIFEVTPDKKVVWEYDERVSDLNGDNPTNFKSVVYYPEGTDWAGKVKDNSLSHFVCR